MQVAAADRPDERPRNGSGRGRTPVDPRVESGSVDRPRRPANVVGDPLLTTTTAVRPSRRARASKAAKADPTAEQPDTVDGQPDTASPVAPSTDDGSKPETSISSNGSHAAAADLTAQQPRVEDVRWGGDGDGSAPAAPVTTKDGHGRRNGDLPTDADPITAPNPITGLAEVPDAAALPVIAPEAPLARSTTAVPVIAPAATPVIIEPDLETEAQQAPGPAVPKVTRRVRWRARRPRIRKVSRVVRRVDPWTVFKISLVFWVLAYVILLVAGVLLWNLASTTGTIGNIEGFVKDLFGLQTFQFDGPKIFRASWLLGAVFALAGTGLNVVAVVLFNLIADLVGGVRITVLEEEVVLRERPVGAPRPRPRG
jgi:hypothetical protein